MDGLPVRRRPVVVKPFANEPDLKKYSIIDEKIADFLQKSGFKKEELEFIEFFKKGEAPVKRVVAFLNKKPIWHIEVNDGICKESEYTALGLDSK